MATLLSDKGTSADAQPDDVEYFLPPVYHAYGLFKAFQCLGHGTTVALPGLPSWPPTTRVRTLQSRLSIDDCTLTADA